MPRPREGCWDDNDTHALAAALHAVVTRHLRPWCRDNLNKARESGEELMRMELARSLARAIERVASALMIQAEEDKRRTHHRVHSSQCVCTCMMHACVKVKMRGDFTKGHTVLSFTLH